MIGYVRLMEREPLTPGPAPQRSQCHCSVCLQTFGAITLFDRHRRGGRCLDPRDIDGGTLRQVNGVWRGPAMTPEQINARKG